jgi:hypothetical protein
MLGLEKANRVDLREVREYMLPRKRCKVAAHRDVSTKTVFSQRNGQAEHVECAPLERQGKRRHTRLRLTAESG